MRTSNFPKAYGNRFRSVDEIKLKLRHLERHNINNINRNNGNGHHHHGSSSNINSKNNNNNFSDYDIIFTRRLYPEIKMPPVEWVGILVMEHPYWDNNNEGPHQIAHIMRHRLDMRHYFPDKYKSTALASGEIYHVDEMTEYKESMLDAIELERLRRQLARRQKIGKIAWCEWDRQAGMFYYQVSECGSLEEPFTEAQYRALCMQERDI